MTVALLNPLNMPNNIRKWYCVENEISELLNTWFAYNNDGVKADVYSKNRQKYRLVVLFSDL